MISCETSRVVSGYDVHMAMPRSIHPLSGIAYRLNSGPHVFLRSQRLSRVFRRRDVLSVPPSSKLGIHAWSRASLT